MGKIIGVFLLVQGACCIAYGTFVIIAMNASRDIWRPLGVGSTFMFFAFLLLVPFSGAGDRK